MSKYFEELRRRKVVRVCIAYIVGAWFLLQIAKLREQVLEMMQEPEWQE